MGCIKTFRNLNFCMNYDKIENCIYSIRRMKIVTGDKSNTPVVDSISS